MGLVGRAAAGRRDEIGLLDLGGPAEALGERAGKAVDEDDNIPLVLQHHRPEVREKPGAPQHLADGPASHRHAFLEDPNRPDGVTVIRIVRYLPEIGGADAEEHGPVGVEPFAEMPLGLRDRVAVGGEEDLDHRGSPLKCGARPGSSSGPASEPVPGDASAGPDLPRSPGRSRLGRGRGRVGGTEAGKRARGGRVRKGPGVDPRASAAVRAQAAQL